MDLFKIVPWSRRLWERGAGGSVRAEDLGLAITIPGVTYHVTGLVIAWVPNRTVALKHPG